MATTFDLTKASALPADAYAIIPKGYQAKVLIRRFTDSLPGDNELEISAKEAQAEIDKTERERHLERLYSNVDDDNKTHFYPAAIAKDELQKTLSMLRENVTQNEQKLAKRLFRSTADKKVIDVLQTSLSGSDFTGLQSQMEMLKSRWDKGHGKIHTSVDQLCGTLSNHSNILKIFPTTNSYVSIFCSSITCLAQAAHNNREISETLLSSVAAISEKVSRCSAWLWIFQTREVKRLLAGIYAKMFEFFHGAMKWFLDSRVGRFFKSFDESIKEGFDTAKDSIETQVEELYRQAHIASSAEARCAEVRRQRETTTNKSSASGHLVILCLEATLERVHSERLTLNPDNVLEPGSLLQSGPRSSDIEPAIRPAEGGITRQQLREYEPHLRRFIVGNEGQDLLSSAVFWRADDLVLFRWRAWMMKDTQSSTLWVSSQPELDRVTSAKALAFSTILASWQAEMPVISHFCTRAREDEVHDGMSKGQVGLLGLVYSLICQLIQFGHGDEVLDIQESVKALDGRSESWSASLDVLKALLDRMPQRFLCVIHGLNNLEWGEQESMCRQVIEILLARQKKSGVVLGLLITTDGQSRLLASLVSMEDRCLSDKKAKEIVGGNGSNAL